MKPALRTLPPLAVPVLFLASCGEVSPAYRERRLGTDVLIVRDFVSGATVDLENRGHTYRAGPEKTWRAVHRVLRGMGVRVLRENRGWLMIDETDYARTPPGEINAFVRDLNRKRAGPRVVAARYRLSIVLNSEASEATTVFVRVFPQIKREGDSRWLPVPPNKRFIEYFFRRLDRMLPVYRDASGPMWKDW